MATAIASRYIRRLCTQNINFSKNWNRVYDSIGRVSTTLPFILCSCSPYVSNDMQFVHSQSMRIKMEFDLIRSAVQIATLSHDTTVAVSAPGFCPHTTFKLHSLSDGLETWSFILCCQFIHNLAATWRSSPFNFLECAHTYTQVIHSNSVCAYVHAKATKKYIHQLTNEDNRTIGDKYSASPNYRIVTRPDRRSSRINTLHMRTRPIDL